MISVRVFNAHSKYRRHHSETIRLVKRVLRNEKRYNAEINVVFNDDRQIEKLNTEFLKHAYPTDVISFSLMEEDLSKLVGEVYVNIDQAIRQAHEYRVSLSNELARLTVHGVLHLLGYDDRTVLKRGKMSMLEDRYLKLY